MTPAAVSAASEGCKTDAITTWSRSDRTATPLSNR
jgi:hypothetical protein